jgi:hypothetical protein
MKQLFPLLLVAATSCTSIYLPNAQNVPTFKGAKEWEATASAQAYMPITTAAAYSFQVQGAYSFTKHVGAMANYTYFSRSSGSAGHLGELGIGYYTNVENIYLGVFLGHGVSSQISDKAVPFYSDAARDRTAAIRENADTWASRSQNWFLQPSIGIRFSDRFIWLLSFKMNRVDFESTYYGYNNSFVLQEDYLASYHIEPSSTFKLNFIKPQISLLYQTVVSSTNGNHPYLPKATVVFSVGIQYRLPQLK